MSRFTAACACGKPQWAAEGKPILSAICYCDDCQAGARQIEALAGAPRVAQEDGGTSYVLFRKDRFRRIGEAGPLLDLHLREGSPSKRVVAPCCNSGVFLDFEKGHWLSVYADRLAPKPPEPTMAVQTRFRRPDAGPLPVPRAFPSFAPAFFGKLLLARLAMLAGR